MRYFFLSFLLLLLLITPKPGWSAERASGSAQEAAAAAEKEGEGEETLGRGEGFETKAEEAKEGVEYPATFGPIISRCCHSYCQRQIRHSAHLGGFLRHRCVFPQLAAGISRGRLCEF